MKVLFLTGCNGQLGFSFAEIFSRENWLVVGLDVQPTSSNPCLHSYLFGDVTSRKSFHHFFRFNHFPFSSLTDICLVNNAGVAVFTPSESRTEDEFDYVTKVNLLGPIYGITEFRDFLVDNCTNSKINTQSISSSVINISSVYSMISPNNSIYTDTARNSSEI